MKKYSKKSNNILVISIFILIAVLVISSSFLIYIYTQNYIKVERIDNRSSNQKTDTIKAARPIYINNLLLGGVDSKKWISGSSMYSVATNVKEEEVDLYDLTSKIGTYMVTAVNKELKTKQVYIKTDRILNVEEYIAVPTD